MEGPDVRRRTGYVHRVRVTVDRLAAVIDQRERPSRLVAPAHLQAEREGSREVFAREATLGRHVAKALVGSRHLPQR